ncbi:caspase family protein [Amycolatopsis sp. cg9]|uniref:caspase, EACC1-associated type n=1 Tax=Amycolatopsis sp. cg9 TaxID=3238801 RepID=UPI0035234145
MKTPGSHTAPAGRRLALLIACDEYADPGLGSLRGPARDVDELNAVLGDPGIGDFTVTVLANRSAHEVRIAINRLFATAARNDLLLLHISGHGVKDAAGRLHFAAADTSLELLSATGISADFVRDEVDRSPARQVALWLDCCFSGAFPAGLVPKSGGRVDVVDQLSTGDSRGCLVMTASNHVEHAFELGADAAPAAPTAPSFFTEAIIEGLRSGDADLDSDGQIEAGELYTYVRERVRARTPHQTPTRSDRVSGPVYLAYSRKSPPLPRGLDPELRTGLQSKHATIRRGAFRALNNAADDGDPAAIEALRVLDEFTLPPVLSTTATAGEGPPPSPRGRRRAMLAIGAATVAVAVVATVLVKLLGAGSDHVVGTALPASNLPQTGVGELPTRLTSSPSSATSTPPSTSADASAKWVTVRVYNNTTVKGLAEKAADDLRARGWNVAEVMNYSQGVLPKTTAYYRPGTDEETAAKQIEAENHLPAEPRFAAIENASPGVIIIVTSDYANS